MAGSDGKKRTPYQRGVIRRYYENREAISAQKLGELVSELYLATSERKAARLWERVEKALRHTDVSPARLEKVLSDRDVEALAELVASLF